MSRSDSIVRSPQLMSPDDTGLLVVDMQQRLLAAIDGRQRVVWNVRRLIDAAGLLGLPVAATEQYPQGLGPTVPEIADRLYDGLLDHLPDKLTFSACGCPGALAAFRERGVVKILVCGIETHVCIAQTVFDLMADGWGVYVAVDAVGSRFPLDHRTAISRMDSGGATLSTTEAAMFELCQSATAGPFKQISRLAKEIGPASGE